MKWKNVYRLWTKWKRANHVVGARYTELYGRLVRSPAARKIWKPTFQLPSERNRQPDMPPNDEADVSSTEHRE